jgi:hypothetical protein
MTTPRNRERGDRYYGGGRGGYTGGADGRNDRYHGGGRGGFTSSEGAGGRDSRDDGARDQAAPLQEDWRRRR